MRGWDRKPVAVIRKRVAKVSPPASATRHISASSSHWAPSTVVLNRMWRRTSYLSATSAAYCLTSPPGANSRDHVGFGSNQYE